MTSRARAWFASRALWAATTTPVSRKRLIPRPRRGRGRCPPPASPRPSPSPGGGTASTRGRGRGSGCRPGGLRWRPRPPGRGRRGGRRGPASQSSGGSSGTGGRRARSAGRPCPRRPSRSWPWMVYNHAGYTKVANRTMGLEMVRRPREPGPRGGSGELPHPATGARGLETRGPRAGLRLSFVDHDAPAADHGRGVRVVVGAHLVVVNDLARERDPDLHPELVLPAAAGELPVDRRQQEG